MNREMQGENKDIVVEVKEATNIRRHSYLLY